MLCKNRHIAESLSVWRLISGKCRVGQRTGSGLRRGNVRIEIGPRDIEKGTVAVVRRDTPPKEKQFLGREEALSSMATILGIFTVTA